MAEKEKKRNWLLTLMTNFVMSQAASVGHFLAAFVESCSNSNNRCLIPMEVNVGIRLGSIALYC